MLIPAIVVGILAVPATTALNRPFLIQGKVITLTKAPLCQGRAPGASRSGRRRLNRDSCSECTLYSTGENARPGDPAAFKTTVVHLV